MQQPKREAVDLEIECRIIASNAQSALAAHFVDPELINTALVQVLTMLGRFGIWVSVYAVYREAGMTFEATARLQLQNAADQPETILRGLVLDPQFHDRLLGPLIKQVLSHFRRAEQHPDLMT